MAPAQAAAAAAAAAESRGRGRGRGRTESKSEEDYDQQQPNSSKEKIVCVMDASGALGGALVNSLLQRGYFVHAAFQSHSDSLSQGQSQNELLQCHGTDGSDNNKNLKIFHADLLDYHSILDTLSGCSALFYTFEPPPEHPVYDEHMAETEVRAAHNVLEACAQTPTMEKVIFTSSATAVVWTDTYNDSSTSSDDIDEKSWSDINLCKKFKLWHALSKTLAEKTAWALAMDRGVNMVSINGGLLLENNNLLNTPDAAPPTNKQKTPNHLPPYLKGAAEMYEQGVLVAVDLRFLVDAHICIFEEASSYGRYLCFNYFVNCHKDAVKLASMFMPSPPQSLEDTRVFPQRISNKKLNRLMVNKAT